MWAGTGLLSATLLYAGLTLVAEGIGSGVVVLEASVLGFSVGMAAHQGGAVTHSGADVTHCAVALVGC